MISDRISHLREYRIWASYRCCCGVKIYRSLFYSISILRIGCLCVLLRLLKFADLLAQEFNSLIVIFLNIDLLGRTVRKPSILFDGLGQSRTATDLFCLSFELIIQFMGFE